MGLLIGMDEAGYGPNLGPLVVTATAWEVPDDPAAVDLYDVFRDAVARDWKGGDARAHVADSKVVYSPRTGLHRLEWSVFAGLGLRFAPPKTYRELCRLLTGSGTNGDEVDGRRWFAENDLPLPVACQNGFAPKHQAAAERWRECCAATGVKLRDVCSEIVWPRRWNRLLNEHGNKSNTLTWLSLQLLRRVWRPGSDEPAMIVGDKHGGRNRYDLQLQEIADGEMILRLDEGLERSVYRIGRTEIVFQTKGEQHLPVALASMVSKYLRELSMELFNRFWKEHLPGVKPTKGYPSDAKRFHREIAETQQRLGIENEVLWRVK